MDQVTNYGCREKDYFMEICRSGSSYHIQNVLFGDLLHTTTYDRKKLLNYPMYYNASGFCYRTPPVLPRLEFLQTPPPFGIRTVLNNKMAESNEMVLPTTRIGDLPLEVLRMILIAADSLTPCHKILSHVCVQWQKVVQDPLFHQAANKKGQGMGSTRSHE